MAKVIVRKRCTGCGKVKALDEFWKAARGRLWACKACYRARNTVYTRKTHRERRRRLTAMFGNRCSHCRSTFPSCAFDLHHTDHTKKDFQFNKLVGRSWERIVAEAAKCVLLCACCHRIEHERLRNEKEAKEASSSDRSRKASIGRQDRRKVEQRTVEHKRKRA